jgi:hypothetical protein
MLVGCGEKDDGNVVAIGSKLAFRYDSATTQRRACLHGLLRPPAMARRNTVVKNVKTLLIAMACLMVPYTLMLAACGDDAPPNVGGQATVTSSSSTSSGNSGICLLNNCSEDEHCDACPDSRTICLKAENRCVACDPNTPDQGCPDGEVCSPFGICAPKDLTCPTDNDGVPTVTCVKNADCKACSPQNQICNDGKCQACSDTNTQHCTQNQVCKDGRCSDKCPSVCTVDNDCQLCGDSKACFNHKCAECSDTYPCATGLECVEGVCTPPCGIAGQAPGSCEAVEDCGFCGASGKCATDAECQAINPDYTCDSKSKLCLPKTPWNCKTPVNDTRGTCVPPAAGCEDLGKNVVVLPPPYDKYTQTCSTDQNCVDSKAGIQYNVGKLVRDLAKTDKIKVGSYEIAIGDANVDYAMPKCAFLEVADKKCGICVPCTVDSDCGSIKVQPLMQQIFSNDPLATLASFLLLDLIWGKDNEPALHFWCQPVAAGYGACIPCGDPTKPCGTTNNNPGTGNCDHDVCTEGTALKADCGSCAAKVCAADSFCCDGTNGKWDSLCVNKANSLCGNICMGGNPCEHDVCTTGNALSDNCNACVASVCGADPFCCNSQSGSWDNICVTTAADTTTHPACANACMGGCAHSECLAGAKLSATCSQCATDVCAKDSFCCDTDWDAVCVSKAKMESSCSSVPECSN